MPFFVQIGLNGHLDSYVCVQVGLNGHLEGCVCVQVGLNGCLRIKKSTPLGKRGALFCGYFSENLLCYLLTFSLLNGYAVFG